MTWTAPPNSGNFRIELGGASGGGKRGGAGALIGASLNLNAGAELKFVLGGAGKRGGSSSSGFNGGGSAGRGEEAAGGGGGMSQVFLSSATTNPILVAGGGGGAGGGDRSEGGAAGLAGLAGSNSTYSTGGGGGESSRGGLAGGSSWVFKEATAGQARQGGTGATVLNGAPGGGGGGGYFGGGGGGATAQDCCHPGSGGGGGSSFVDSEYLSDIEVTAAPIGSGFARIHYQLLPAVANHNWSQVDESSGSLRIEFTATLAAVRLDRVSVTGCDRFSAKPTGAIPSKTWTFSLQSCTGPNLLFALNPGSLEARTSADSALFGPTSEHEISIQFTGPAAAPKFQGPNLFMGPTATLLLVAERPLSGLTSSDLEIPGCDLFSIQTVRAGFEIKLRNCSDGKHTLRLAAASIRDSFGNQVPSSDRVHGFRVDLLPPTATLQLLDLNQDSRTAQIELSLSEAVTSPLKQLESQMAEAGCESEWVKHSDLRFIASLSCDSPITLSISSGSLSDAAGRPGPASEVKLAIPFTQTGPLQTSPESAIPPWIPIREPSASAPEIRADALAPAGDEAPNLEALRSITSDPMTLRYFGLGVLTLLALVLGFGALRLVHKRRKAGQSASGKNDGALAVDKYPVFGKPAHRLG